MKGQDIAILVKTIILENKSWTTTQLATELNISQSEVSKALTRLAFSGLLDESKRHPARRSIYDLLVSSIKFIIPVKPGRVVKGIPTAHSAEPLKEKIISDLNYVWPSAKGTMRGEGIEPLYPNLSRSVGGDKKFHEFMALIDVLRVGKVREVEVAKKELKKRIIDE
jgi:DNA-binding MarR family transcriptional regulator